MIAKTILAAALAVFKYNSQVDELHVTEDGNAFVSENLAKAHAHTAKLPAPVSVTREQAMLSEDISKAFAAAKEVKENGGSAEDVKRVVREALLPGEAPSGIDTPAGEENSPEANVADVTAEGEGGDEQLQESAQAGQKQEDEPAATTKTTSRRRR